jgi:hypothetical protein
MLLCYADVISHSLGGFLTWDTATTQQMFCTRRRKTGVTGLKNIDQKKYYHEFFIIFPRHYLAVMRLLSWYVDVMVLYSGGTWFESRLCYQPVWLFFPGVTRGDEQTARSNRPASLCPSVPYQPM